MNFLGYKFQHGPPLQKAQKEISYASLKAILMHMEANKRFQLAAQIPCIRYAEKGTPLKINHLGIAPSHLYINEMVYNLGVIRVGTHLPHFQRINDEGGEYCDLDEFGGQDYSMDSVLTPGDILIQKHEEIEFDIEEQEEILEELRALPDQTESEKLEIEEIEARIYTWRLRQDNTPAPYNMQLQFSTWQRHVSGQKLGIERWNYNYNENIHEAMKCLTEKLFGNRLQTINVKRLWICHVGVLRLPEDLFIKIRCLEMSSQVAQMENSLKSLVHRKSFPLDYLTIFADSEFEEVENHEHEWVTSSDTLTIRKNPFIQNSWAHILMKAQNRQVELYHGRLNLVEINRLVDKIIERQRAIGTAHSFDEGDPVFINMVMDSLRRRQNAEWYRHGRWSTPCPFDVILPMTANNRLLIYCEKSSGDSAKWKFVMAVKEAEKSRRAVSRVGVVKRSLGDCFLKAIRSVPGYVILSFIWVLLTILLGNIMFKLWKIIRSQPDTRAYGLPTCWSILFVAALLSFFTVRRIAAR